MSSVPAVGIDLGTIYSSVSVYQEGWPKVISNRFGQRLTPSIVYYDSNGGEPYVGETAAKLLKKRPQSCLLDAKLFIGRQYENEVVTRYVNSKLAQFSLTSGEDDLAVFEVEISNERITKTPEEVTAEVLKYLKNVASDYLGGTVTKAVVSIPAFFSNAQRRATRVAGQLAGFDELKLIAEPTAAALHYVTDKRKEKSNMLVFDFGGGTLDISIIKVRKGKLEVKAVYGDTSLGGRNFDENLYGYFYKKLTAMNYKKIGDIEFKIDLYNSSIELKEMLSDIKEFKTFVGSNDRDWNVNINMTRAQFEKLNDGIFQQIMDIIEFCMKDSGLIKSDIDDVILVGGSTRIPRIQELLKSYFGPEKIRTDLNPDEAVASGASIKAAFSLDNKDSEGYKVTEVTPMSLGIARDKSLMACFLPKNTPIPNTFSDTFRTIYDNQYCMTIPIFEGQRKYCAFNNKLGIFQIENFTKRPAGDVKFAIDFNLDEDGILTLTTRDIFGENNEGKATMKQFGLSDRIPKLSCKNENKYKIEDAMFEKFLILKRRFQKQCCNVLDNINKVLIETDREYVRDCSEKFLKGSNVLNFTEIKTLEEEFAKYNKAINGILKKNVMLELLYTETVI